MPETKEPIFFSSPAEWRRWLQRNHSKAGEVWVGFHKRATGKPSLTWPESVDEALCFGWIDGVRKSIDASAYKIRFTPRKTRSVWSAINIKRAAELIEQKRMAPAGKKAFEARTDDRSVLYSYEQRKNPKLPVALAKKFRASKKALAFFESQAPWYQRTATWWVISARKDETRLKRLETLIADSAAGRRIAPLS
jgi:uncharacterized protein YdeI (YjbR/CyaY-like superfamily)